MLERAAEQLGLKITGRLSETEFTAVEPSGMTEKTVAVMENNEFARSLIERMTALPPSPLSAVERVEEWEGKLLAVCPDAGRPANSFTVYDAYAACCAALVLRELGAAHRSIVSAVRRCGERSRVYGLSDIVPLTEEAERNELAEIRKASGVESPSLERLREELAVSIGRWDIARRKAAGAEAIRATLLAQPEFRREWSELEYINAGAYGCIYRATRADDGTVCALKVMSVGDDMEMLWKAKRESTNASQFYRSDYIARTYDDGKIVTDTERFIWISMELLEPIPCEISDEVTVAMIARDVCLALEEIHRNGGMAHRDVKPGNILRGKDHWKLCDFGITKEVQGREMATVIGTSDYMAPELLKAVASNTEKTSYNNTVDIYALGITMYTLLNRGTAPFLTCPPFMPTPSEKKTANVRRIKGEPLPKAINCGEGLMKIISRACSADPAARYSSVGKMYDALENFLDDYS